MDEVLKGFANYGLAGLLMAAFVYVHILSLQTFKQVIESMNSQHDSHITKLMAGFLALKESTQEAVQELEKSVNGRLSDLGRTVQSLGNANRSARRKDQPPKDGGSFGTH